MADLSKLCTICYSEVPKYRCPRCKTQTCSLPCYQKHQQRASCSGKRDPTSYLKKSQLATPTGLDRDYNYLRGIEQCIGNASNPHKSSQGGHSSLRNVSSGWRAESKLQKYLTDNQITRERAPHGMSRQRENNTRATRVHEVLWTIEWRIENGERELQHDCEGTSTVAHLYSRLHKAKRRASKANDEQETAPPPTKKPKQNEPPAGISSEAQASAAQNTKTDATVEESADAALEAPTTESLCEAEATRPPRNFYLLKPATASASRVLIPIDSTVSLTANLKGQIVQEYPSIYVLDQGPDSLPEGFTVLGAYAGTQAAESAALQSREQPSSVKAELPTKPEHKPEEADGQLDAISILDMLKRDVRA